MAVSNKTADVFRGPATLELDDATVGLISGDATVTVERQLEQETAEPFGGNPHNLFHGATLVRVRVALAQTVRENLIIAMGGHGGSGYGYFEDRPGRVPTYNLKLKPVTGSGGGTDAATNFLELYKAAIEEVGDVVFSRTAERNYEVTFLGLIDENRQAGRRVGKWLRPDAT